MSKNNNSPLSSFLKQAGIISLIGVILIEIVTYIDQHHSEEAVVNDEIAASLPAKEVDNTTFTNAPHALTISYQGASAYLPASSLESTTAATILEADFINLKVALTKDQVVVVTPSINLSKISNIAQLYPNQDSNTGYLVSNFTYDQLKAVTLFAEVANSDKPLEYHLATLSEHLEVIQDLSKDLHKTVGVFPELLQAKYYLAQQQDLALKTIEVLKTNNFTNPESVYLLTDSFEALKQARADLLDQKVSYQLIQVIKQPNPELNLDSKFLPNNKDLATVGGLEKISHYANGVAVSAPYLFTNNGNKLNIVNNNFTQKLELDKTLSFFPYLVNHDDQVLTKDQITQYFNLLNKYKFNIIGIVTPYPNQKFYFQK